MNQILELAHNYDCDLLHYKLEAFIMVKLMFTCIRCYVVKICKESITAPSFPLCTFYR